MWVIEPLRWKKAFSERNGKYTVENELAYQWPKEKGGKRDIKQKINDGAYGLQEPFFRMPREGYSFYSTFSNFLSLFMDSI